MRGLSCPHGPTAATRRTCRSWTLPTARPGSRTSSEASRSSPSTVGRRDFWFRTCTSGRAPSGCVDSSWSTMTSRLSGRRAATTTTATPGRSTVTGATERVGSPVTWRLATVSGLIRETPRAKTIVFDVPGWPGHVAGQHVDVRLTAEDGYQTERSYSIASAPEEPMAELTVERIDDGEVSPYLTEELRVGDRIQVGGPVPSHFVWRGGG